MPESSAAPWAAHPWLDLARDLLHRGGTVCYREASGSMRPTIRPHDEVEIRPVALRDLRRGDVIALAAQAELRVHRFLGLLWDAQGPWLLTQGDAAARPDPPWARWALLGRVLRVRRAGRWVALDRGLVGARGRLRAAGRWLPALLRPRRLPSPDVSGLARR